MYVLVEGWINFVTKLVILVFSKNKTDFKISEYRVCSFSERVDWACKNNAYNERWK